MTPIQLLQFKDSNLKTPIQWLKWLQFITNQRFIHSTLIHSLLGIIDWNQNAEEITDMNQWEDNWDDDDIEDDFSNQLRAELKKWFNK